eukprot:991281-Karenia_brevis.AAC.1
MRRQGGQSPEGAKETGRRKQDPNKGEDNNKKGKSKNPRRSTEQAKEWNNRPRKKKEDGEKPIIHPIFKAFIRIATLNIVTMTNKITTIADFMEKHNIDA